MFNHLSNNTAFWFNICIYFLPQNIQTLELLDVITKGEGIQLIRTLISNFKPGPQADTVLIPFMHLQPKRQVIHHHINYHP